MSEVESWCDTPRPSRGVSHTTMLKTTWTGRFKFSGGVGLKG